ncbi:ATP/GTP-binding protein [Streptococcus sp. sy018]|uniref:AAA family ATPase n=1 Tax=Streptococcus sp. sy018 TaxID=2600147 RepID=UPI0016470FAC|nr:AAA family ATPase [Streptococcus sp. sy018]
MKLLKIIFENGVLFDEKLEIDFFSEARVSTDEKHELIHLFNNFYANRTLTFTGLNASGKTQLLNTLVIALNIIQAKSINYSPRRVIRNFGTNNILHLDNNKQVKFTIFFYDETDGNQTVNKLESIIARRFDEDEGEFKYVFVDEIFSRKNVKSIRSKKQIFDFTSIKEENIITRNNDNKYVGLSSDVSIMNIFFNLNEIEKLYYKDKLSYTNFNILSGFGKIPHELITYLDPSIEKLEFIVNEENNTVRVILKFVNQVSPIELESISELNNILSSGTVKGIGLFMDAFFTLRSGGIIIVDELENHFNREIVSTFINLFLDRKMNPNGAVLIYSTHYSELLDIVPRNDSIYIVNKKRRISIEKFSNIIKRNDISKSDVFIKGMIDNSTPDYSSEHFLKEIIKQRFLTKVGLEHGKKF